MSSPGTKGRALALFADYQKGNVWQGSVDVPPYEIPRKSLPPDPLPKGFGKTAFRLGKGQRRK